MSLLTKAERKARRGRNKLTKESHVLRGVLDLLAAEKIPHYRLNSGSVIVDGRRVKLCPKGTPDVLALWPKGRVLWGNVDPYYAHAVFIETKRPLSGILSASQKAEIFRLRSAGASVLIVDDVSQLQEIIRPAAPARSR